MNGHHHSYCSKLPKQLVFDGHMLSESVEVAWAMTAHAEICTTTILINRNGFATPELERSRQNEILSLPEY